MLSTRAQTFLALALASGLLLATGCASSQAVNMRGLSRGEASELLALQAQRDKPSEAKPVTDPAQVEAIADHTAAQGNWAAAIQEYGRALSLAKDSDKPRLRAKSAELCLKSRMFAPAEALFADLAAGDPQNPVYLQGLGLARFAQDKLDEAQAELSKAVALSPQLWRAHNALGIIANRQRRPEQALVHFRLALALEPGLPALYNNRALSHMLLKDWPGAEESLRQALALDPQYGLAANNLGLVLAKQGRGPEALRAFEKGAGQAQAHNNLGVVLAQQGRFNQAAQQFRQAVETMPRYYPLAGRHLEQVDERLQGQPSAWSTAPVSNSSSKQELPRVERPGLAAPAAEEGVRASTISYSPQDNAAPRPTRRGPFRDPGDRQPAFSEPLVMTETPEPVGQSALLAPEPKPRPLSPPPVAAQEPLAPAPAPLVAQLAIKQRPSLSQDAPAPRRSKAAPQEPAAGSRQARQSLPVGFVGVVSEKNQTHLVEGVAVGQDGLLHRVQGDASRLAQGIAIGAGGDTGETNRAQRVVRGKIEGGDIGAGQ
jgi:Flp pilus assembly protein TadD